MVRMIKPTEIFQVTPRERRVSRNQQMESAAHMRLVTPRERRVSRNDISFMSDLTPFCHASREACE